MVCGPVPSPRMCTSNSPARPTTATDTGQPLALQSAIAVVAMITAASTEMSLRVSVCADAGAAIAQDNEQARAASATRVVAAVMSDPPLKAALSGGIEGG